MRTRLVEGSRLHVSFASKREELFPTRIKIFYTTIFFYRKYIFYGMNIFFLI